MMANVLDAYPPRLAYNLAQYTGTEQWHKCTINGNVTCTDGVLYFAETVGGFWFLDIIGTELYAMRNQQPFMDIHLIVADSKAKIEVNDGNGHVFYTRDITYTDCPEGDWQFYFTNGVILLPSEY